MFDITLGWDNGHTDIVEFTPLTSSFRFRGEPLSLEFFQLDPSEIEAVKKEKFEVNNIRPLFDGCNVGKIRNLSGIRIQLGLKCNYSCSYCVQAHGKGNDFKIERDDFVERMDEWLVGEPKVIEFWGGEPFVYWKTLRPLVEKLRAKFPKTNFSMFTNGSLLDIEKIDWLYDMRFGIGVSHDGPGQYIRGDDPFDDPYKADMLRYLFTKLGERVSFHSVLTKDNCSFMDCLTYFEEKLGTDNFSFSIEGFVVAHSDDGANLSPMSDEEYRNLRHIYLRDMLNPKSHRHPVVRTSMINFIRQVLKQADTTQIGQGCGLDRLDKLVVNLNGDVVVCQNNGTNLETLGSVYDFDNIRMKHATSWHGRDCCNHCPSFMSCHGECMILEGNLRKVSCDNKFNIGLAKLAMFLYATTGGKIVSIEAHDGSYIRTPDVTDFVF